MARSRRGGLRRRLLAWFLLFSIVPLLVTNAVGYRRSELIIRRLVERDLSAVAHAQAQHVRDRADHSMLLLQAVAVGNEFLAAGARRAQGLRAGAMGEVASRHEMERLLARKLDELRLFDALYVFAPSGAIAAAVGVQEDLPTQPPPTPVATGSFSAMLRPTPLGMRPVFRIAVPVQDDEGLVVAYLAGTLSLDAFRAMLEVPDLPTGHVQSVIVDAGGRPLLSSIAPGEIDYANPLITPLFGLPDDAHTQYVAAAGTPVLGTIVGVPGHEWRLVAESSMDEEFGPLRRLARLSLMLEMALVAAIAVTALVVSRRMVAPLNKLVEASRRVARGDLSGRVATFSGGDEIGEMETAFNEMTAALAATTRDVHTLHQREIERASQLATVGELASGVAHEIKNPIVGVSNGLDIVRRRAGGDPSLVPILEEMDRQMQRVQGAIQDLLAFARPATPALDPVHGNDLVERAIRLAQPTAEKGGVRIDVRLDPTQARVLADKEMVHQALINLLMNALEATARGGRVDVYARLSGHWLAIDISDNGCGIAPEHLELVFKPFFTTRHTGTGLGLSITREIVQRHGGTIELRSRVGEGTSVTIQLPVCVGRDLTTSTVMAP